MSSSIQLDRPHRFEVGDMVRHVDSDEHDPASRIIIEAQTLRIVRDDGRAYPTYTISSRTYGIKEFVEDVLDTDDLIKIPYIKAKIVIGQSKEDFRETAKAIKIASLRNEIEHGHLDDYLNSLQRSIEYRQSQLEPRASRRES